PLRRVAPSRGGRSPGPGLLQARGHSCRRPQRCHRHVGAISRTGHTPHSGQRRNTLRGPTWNFPAGPGSHPAVAFPAAALVAAPGAVAPFVADLLAVFVALFVAVLVSGFVLVRALAFLADWRFFPGFGRAHRPPLPGASPDQLTSTYGSEE